MFPTFSFKKNFQPPFEEFLEMNFLLYQFYTLGVMISDSLVVNTPGCEGRSPGFKPHHGQTVTVYIFAITTH
jgi:hypothetical protein